MSTAIPVCPKCKSAADVSQLNSGELVTCLRCDSQIQVEVFPALFRSAAVGAAAETIVAEGEAGCFFHPQKRAIVPCESCGRFLCALCDVELHGQHLCPACLELGRKQGKLKSLENHRTLYDSAALLCATLPVLVGLWPSMIGAPMALFLCVRYWNAPSNYVRPGKWRFILAAILAVAEIVGWIVFFATFPGFRR